MVIELDWFLSKKLRSMPKDHPDRAFLEDTRQIVQRYIESQSSPDSSLPASPFYELNQERRLLTRDLLVQGSLGDKYIGNLEGIQIPLTAVQRPVKYLFAKGAHKDILGSLNEGGFEKILDVLLETHKGLEDKLGKRKAKRIEQNLEGFFQNLKTPPNLRLLRKLFDPTFLENYIQSPPPKEEFDREIDNVLGTLKQRERRVISLTTGLINGVSYALEEVALMFAVTKSRIRQIEGGALRKLRHPKRFARLKHYLF